jgi:hypothetical protein
MIMDKYGNYGRKFMWQLCGWGIIDICMTFHMRAFDFFTPLHIDLKDMSTLSYPHSCHINFRTLLPYLSTIHFASPNTYYKM